MKLTVSLVDVDVLAKGVHQSMCIQMGQKERMKVSDALQDLVVWLNIAVSRELQ